MEPPPRLVRVEVLRAEVLRVEVRLAAPDAFAAAGLRVLVVFFAPVLLVAVERDADVLRFAVDLRAPALRPVLLRLVPLRAEVLRADEEELPLSSIGHLPDITRWAASATASAMSEPSLVALDTIELAALLAVSAASIPASLIALRAFGLALIAAAAAARPAASISLLIAALASLSTVVLLEFELFELEDDFDDPLRVLDFAIANLPSSPLDG